MSTSDVTTIWWFPPLITAFKTLKPMYSIGFSELLLLKSLERSESHSCFCFCSWGLGLAPTRHRVRILNGSEKVPSVCPCSMLFKLCFFSDFSPSFVKNCPLTEWSEVKKFEQSENIGQFFMKNYDFPFFYFLNLFKSFVDPLET